MTDIQLQRALGAAVVILVTTLAAPVSAQQTGSISGVVRSAAGDSGLSGALVSVEGRLFNTQADAQGRFRIEGLPAGKAKLTAQVVGFTPARQVVGVGPGTDTAIELRLVPAAVQLAELTVIGTPADLDERRERLAQVPGSVALIESEQLRRTRQANLKDVLGFTPGVYRAAPLRRRR